MKISIISYFYCMDYSRLFNPIKYHATTHSLHRSVAFYGALLVKLTPYISVRNFKSLFFYLKYLFHLYL
jgi:hypothetical protein